MFRGTMNDHIEVVIRVNLEQSLSDVFVLFWCMSDMDLSTIGAHKLSDSLSSVMLMAKGMVWCRRSTIGSAVGTGFVDYRQRNGALKGLLVACTGTPWLPVRCRTAKKGLPRHLVT